MWYTPGALLSKEGEPIIILTEYGATPVLAKRIADDVWIECLANGEVPDGAHTYAPRLWTHYPRSFSER